MNQDLFFFRDTCHLIVIWTHHTLLPPPELCLLTWFTEGFDTKDLQEAKALLQELSQ